jgi:HrpA-like RNA helicase
MGKRRPSDHVKPSKLVKFTDNDQNVIDDDGSNDKAVLASKLSSASFEELQQIRRSLPIYEAREALVRAISKAQVSIGIFLCSCRITLP